MNELDAVMLTRSYFVYNSFNVSFIFYHSLYISLAYTKTIPVRYQRAERQL